MTFNLAFSIVSLLGGLASLVPVFADLAGNPVGGWPRSRRVVTAIGLVLLGSVTGLAAYFRSTHASKPLASDETRTHGESTQTSTTGEVMTTTRSPVMTSSTPANNESGPTRATRGSAARVGIVISDENGNVVPVLVAAARHLSGRGYAVRGSLAESVEYSSDLEGMHTVHLTLDVTVMKADDLVTAFSVQSRGGGFQAEAARTQALERLRDVFGTRLQEEVP